MGGLHCAAWNAPFSSDLEVFLWRVSSVAVSATVVLMFFLFLWELSPPLDLAPFDKLPEWAGKDLGIGIPVRWVRRGINRLRRVPHRNCPWAPWLTGNFLYVMWFAVYLVAGIGWFTLVVVSRFCFDTFVVGFIILYFLSRAFLVVECFINLTHLPDSAFQVPKWTQYMPAIS